MNVIRNLFKGKQTAVCGKCGSKIDHFGFTLADFTKIESGSTAEVFTGGSEGF